ncbi:MAG: MBOAT family protein, partial [Oscillospiraceae bacterium]
YLMSYGIMFVIAGYFCTPHFKTLIDKAEISKSKASAAVSSIAYAAVFLLCIAYLVNSTYNPFLYFRF